jgi:hypothetical protein
MTFTLSPLPEWENNFRIPSAVYMFHFDCLLTCYYFSIGFENIFRDWTGWKILSRWPKSQTSSLVQPWPRLLARIIRATMKAMRLLSARAIWKVVSPALTSTHGPGIHLACHNSFFLCQRESLDHYSFILLPPWTSSKVWILNFIT